MTDSDLLNILEDLGPKDFKDFKWHLKREKVDDLEPIKESKLSEAERQDVVDLTVQKYKFAGAVDVFKSILEKISRNDLVEKLLNISSGAEGQSQEETNMTSHPNSSSVRKNSPDKAWLQPKIQNQPIAFDWRTLFGVNRTQDSGPDLRIIMVGRTGVGKSASGNTILGEKRFRSRPWSESVTETCEKGETRWGNRVVTVVDTPGILDTAKSAEFITKEIVRCVKVSYPGPHVFLLVFPLDRFTPEDKISVEALQELFGPRANQFMIVLFTRGDYLGDRTIQEYVRTGNPDLRRVVQSCGNRLHVFDNTRNDRNQVVELIKKIDDMVAGNGGAYYTDAMYEEVRPLQRN